MPAALPTLDEVRQVVREEIRAALAEGRHADDLPLDTTQAAHLAGVSAKTIRTWVAEGRLQATRRGRAIRITREDLRKAMAGTSPDPHAAVAELLASLDRPGHRRRTRRGPPQGS